MDSAGWRIISYFIPQVVDDLIGNFGIKRQFRKNFVCGRFETRKPGIEKHYLVAICSDEQIAVSDIPYFLDMIVGKKMAVFSLLPIKMTVTASIIPIESIKRAQPNETFVILGYTPYIIIRETVFHIYGSAGDINLSHDLQGETDCQDKEQNKNM